MEDDFDKRMVQEFLEPENVKTTMIFTHVLNVAGRGIRNPADTLMEGVSSIQLHN